MLDRLLHHAHIVQIAGDAPPLLLLASGTELLVRPGGERLALRDEVLEAGDLAVDSLDLRGEVDPRLGGRAERRLVPAQRAAPELGADSAELLREAGLSADEIAKLLG